MFVIYVDFGEVEWDGNLDYIREIVGNVLVIIVVVKFSFFEIVEWCGMFLSFLNC